MKLKDKQTGEIVEIELIYKDKNLGDRPISRHFDKLITAENFSDIFEDLKERACIISMRRDEGYTYVDDIIDAETRGEVIDRAKWYGLYFETEEEAREAVKKLGAFRRLKEHGFKFEGWHRDPDYSGDFTITATDQSRCADKDLNIIFGEED